MRWRDFELAEAGLEGVDALSDAYHRPMARLSDGQALAPVVTAMMDVSDGLLIDAERMVHASKVEIRIDIDAIPLSAAYRAMRGRQPRTADCRRPPGVMITKCFSRLLSMLHYRSPQPPSGA
jgi:thiamine monophosphate kinase